MKKIITFLFAGFFAIAASAQQVVVNSSTDKEIRIDGNTYSKPATNNTNMIIPNLSQGNHTLEVYRVSSGFLGIGKKRELLSRTEFYLGNRNITINVDQNGYARINDRNNNNTRIARNRGRTDNDWNNGRNRDDDYRYKKAKKAKKVKNNPGKKKGHYKHND